MCTVLLRFAPGTPNPVVLGAVRDEFVDRAWDPPAAHWGDRAQPEPGFGGGEHGPLVIDRLLGGRDRTAGGTWLAVDPDRRAVAAVLNGVRLPPPTDGGRPSRGQLPLAALRGEPLPDPAILGRYDGFHLVLATPDEVRVWSWDGTARQDRRLAPGDHVIVNQGIDPDHPITDRLHAADGREDWIRLLADDAVLVERAVGGRRYGSTSTSLVALTPTGLRYEFNPRPRDPSGWSDIRPRPDPA